MANITKLFEDIEAGNRPFNDIDITQFFTKLSNGEYVPDMKNVFRCVIKIVM